MEICDSLNPDIFISYSRRDKIKVDKVVEFLRYRGFTVWIDREGIEGGDKFRGIIANAIEKAKILLFFSSESSNSSEWTKKEVFCAKEDKKCIIPIKLDKSKYNIDIRLELIDLDFIDLTETLKYNEEIERLCRTLNNKLGLAALSHSEETEPTQSAIVEDCDGINVGDILDIIEKTNPIIPVIKKIGNQGRIKLTEKLKEFRAEGKGKKLIFKKRSKS